MRTVVTDVEVEIDLDRFDDDELIEELESRGYSVSSNDLMPLASDTVNQLYNQFTTDQTISPDTLRQLFYQQLGRIA